MSKGGDKMLVYKIDVLAELKEAGYNANRLRKEKLMGQASIQQLRGGKVIGINNLDTLCRLLDCQPGNIIKYVPDEK
jgi:putative transcriptional regulator